VITTLGVIVGLNAGTESFVAVIGGIFIVAIADAMSDALGIHLAQESDTNVSSKQVWTATLSTFIAKFSTTASFALPFLLFPLGVAIASAVVWGYLIICLLSIQLAKWQSLRPLNVVAEHVLIATLVVVASYWVGIWVKSSFGASHITT